MTVLLVHKQLYANVFRIYLFFIQGGVIAGIICGCLVLVVAVVIALVILRFVFLYLSLA